MPIEFLKSLSADLPLRIGKNLVRQEELNKLIVSVDTHDFPIIGAKKSVDWKLREGPVSTGNIEAATFALYLTIIIIENYIKENEPSFNDYYKNKSNIAV